MRKPWTTSDRVFCALGAAVFGAVITYLAFTLAGGSLPAGDQATVRGRAWSPPTKLRPAPVAVESFPPERAAALPLPVGKGLPLAAALDITDDVLDYFWWNESRQGTDPNCREVGKAGERGGYQLTPIFLDDIARLAGIHVNPYDDQQCRWAVRVWLEHYAPRVGAKTVDEWYELYRFGPTGYRRNRKGE